MIVYHELSSLTRDLNYSAKVLYSISNRPGKYYREVLIPKHNGEFRKLHVPNQLLKAVQRKIASVLLFHEPISDYACAYRPGGSIINNAAPHVGHKTIVKLDIRDFFGSITYTQVKRHVFREEKYSEQLRVLLTLLCVYPDSLPQGAPTSPVISNIIMREFDEKIGSWCSERKISYTRYCDDMSFSGEFDVQKLIETVDTELRKMGFYLNEQKTRVVHDGQRKQITGIVVNDKVSVPNDYRRSIRQEIYYCRKYGTDSHLKKTGGTETRTEYLHRLLGRINYVLSVQKTKEFEDYRDWALDQLKF